MDRYQGSYVYFYRPLRFKSTSSLQYRVPSIFYGFAILYSHNSRALSFDESSAVDRVMLKLIDYYVMLCVFCASFVQSCSHSCFSRDVSFASDSLPDFTLDGRKAIMPRTDLNIRVSLTSWQANSL